MMSSDTITDRLTIVLLTYNCAGRLNNILDNLTQLPGKPSIIAVDNASNDQTVSKLKKYRIMTIKMPENIGAAARNTAVKQATTPYIAFCDDDTFWGKGSLKKVVKYFDKHKALTVINARILVGKENKLDPICQEMADSPLLSIDLPGSKIVSFLGGAVAIRRKAFLAVGGYEPRLFMGGEEELLATDLICAGGELRYLPDVVVHHYPSKEHVNSLRGYGVRNALWFVWRRRSLENAWKWTKHIANSADLLSFVRGMGGFLVGLPWVINTRRPVSPEFERELEILDAQRLNSKSRNYNKNQ
jgi:GT2 family glycosyltransferase